MIRPAILACGLGLGCSPSRLGHKAMESQAERADFAMHQVQLDEWSLRYWDGGEGPPLLMLHGFGGDGLTTWRPQLQALAPHRRLIVPDLLWFGGSQGGRPGLEAQISALLALLDHLGLPEVDLMGVSYGGFVSLGLAARQPLRVRQLVLVDSPGFAFTEEDQRQLLTRLGVSHPAEIFIADEPSDVRRMLDLTFHEPLRVPGFVLRDLQRTMFSAHQTEQRALLDDLLAWRGRLGPEQLALTAPPLLVWGRHDEVFPVETGARLAEMIGGSLVIIEDTAHGPCTEAPREFNRVVLEYLLEQPLRPAEAEPG
jgi:pimeloyl-ACP methyl ester carboxylesterase